MRYQFVDCRWELADPTAGRRLYRAGHIPGASYLDVDEQLAAPPVEGGARHPLPETATFAKAAGHAGIGAGVFVVAYGSLGGAERLWWLLRHFGHDDCAVLAGGLDAWQGPLEHGETTVTPAEFEPREQAGDTIDAEELASSLGRPRLVLADARPHFRWRGEPNPIDRVPGRIPGAISTPWMDAVPELPDGDVVAYCGSGVTACVILHRLHLAGRQGRLYPGSWSDWETRDLPRERS